ncbi:LOW QUALITY PROTEIN: hypothetical protein ColTof4_06747 [Colletotrichum tofieldiae]|nr:LOW QUALITY PROTEIN: hypothetical protein ColTof3_11690 [Colletotrichum tofieldiae]GKT74324.1 LOW QUALITY PROTEIN: hypothetical protein ColTof4_06747 [Colletotrichum tofieldiae]GKT91503.1 LOW QUALITY PROTEIN: hypothetical protein Ct61P_09353 [Colletotrichum tofieldiae]
MCYRLYMAAEYGCLHAFSGDTRDAALREFEDTIATADTLRTSGFKVFSTLKTNAGLVLVTVWQWGTFFTATEKVVLTGRDVQMNVLRNQKKSESKGTL